MVNLKRLSNVANQKRDDNALVIYDHRIFINFTHGHVSSAAAAYQKMLLPMIKQVHEAS